jgi:hypothetical protein
MFFPYASSTSYRVALCFVEINLFAKAEYPCGCDGDKH